MKTYTVNEMLVRADYLEGALADAKTAAMLRQAAKIMRVTMRKPERNIDRFAHLTDTNPGGDISTAFSFYLEEQYPPKLRGGVCMDRAYYDFLLWLFSAPGKKGATK